MHTYKLLLVICKCRYIYYCIHITIYYYIFLVNGVKIIKFYFICDCDWQMNFLNRFSSFLELYLPVPRSSKPKPYLQLVSLPMCLESTQYYMQKMCTGTERWKLCPACQHVPIIYKDISNYSIASRKNYVHKKQIIEKLWKTCRHRLSIWIICLDNVSCTRRRVLFFLSPLFLFDC